MSLKRTLSVILLVLMVSGVFLSCLGTVKAELIPTPSVPAFSVTYVDHSYYLPPVYGVDPYSGETAQTGGGYTVQNKSLELKITNIQFTPYTIKDEDGLDRQVGISYEIRYKGHYGQDWKFYTVSDNSPSGYTVVLFGLDWGSLEPPVQLDGLQAGDQIDFEVQARIGYFIYTGVNILYDREYIGKSSGWSNTQIATVPDTYISPSIPEFHVIAVLPLIFVIPIIVIVTQRKRKVLL